MSSDRRADYVTGLAAFYDFASYFAVNISSPNTRGLCDLQAPEALGALLGDLMAARAGLMAQGRCWRPILVKLAPDIEERDLPAIIDCLQSNDVDGIILTNTTVGRDGLAPLGKNDKSVAAQAGGLSGRPLFHRSTVVLARVYEGTSGRIPLIGVGGIDSGEAALAKIEAGASLLQLYTGLVYHGPGLIRRIKTHLRDHLETEGLQTISEAIGVRAGEWASQSINS